MKPLQTVHKAGQVLNLFCMERPEWGVSEAAQALNFPKSSTSALMSALAGQGLLERTAGRRYKLGWRIMAMSQILLETTEFRTEARRAMQYLVSLFGETVHLAALERGQVIYVDKLQGIRAMQIPATGVGLKFSVHASAVGKVLLAYRSWEDVVEILEREGMPALTPNTITTPEGLREELECVRRRGYACDLEEGVLGLCCIAVPIKDHTREVVASMSLSVPTYRFEQSEDNYRTTLMVTGRQLSEKLGYTGAERSKKRRAPKEVVSGNASN